MSEKFDTLSDEHQQWISRQHVFFVATAATQGTINLSPKGQDSLRILNERELVWLNLTGSGNETAAHLLDSNRMTLMWCAFEGLPQILRVYGTAVVIHPRDADWESCTRLIPAPVGARQYFRVSIGMVQTSCGYAVPLMDFQADRDVLTRWSEQRGSEGIAAYWEEKNQTSLDGLPTQILSAPD